MSIVTLLISYALIFQQADTMKVELPANFTGWAYIAGTTDRQLMKQHNGRIVLSEAGIGYTDTAVLNSDQQIVYYKNGRQLKETEVKFAATTEINSSSPTTSYNRRVILFYVLDKQEMAKGDSYWDDQDNRSPIWDIQEKRFKYLMDEGIIILR